jgi:CheY-like chemotaxis protein
LSTTRPPSCSVSTFAAKRQGTYVLHFAYSGEEALDKLCAGIEPRLRVILSDINMPVMDGSELLRQINVRDEKVGRAVERAVRK